MKSATNKLMLKRVLSYQKAVLFLSLKFLNNSFFRVYSIYTHFKLQQFKKSSTFKDFLNGLISQTRLLTRPHDRRSRPANFENWTNERSISFGFQIPSPKKVLKRIKCADLNRYNFPLLNIEEKVYLF